MGKRRFWVKMVGFANVAVYMIDSSRRYGLGISLEIAVKPGMSLPKNKC